MTGKFYEVTADMDRVPLRDHLMHGYETKQDFREAIYRLIRLWRGRVGECIGESHGFLHLRFHDTPGGRPDEARLPKYMLKEVDMPEYMRPEDPPDDIVRELDEAFGFD